MQIISTTIVQLTLLQKLRDIGTLNLPHFRQTYSVVYSKAERSEEYEAAPKD